MGNVHNKRVKNFCNPVKVESVTPKKINTDFGFYSQKAGEEIKTVSVGLSDSGCTASILLVCLTGGYILLYVLPKHFKKGEPTKPWQTNRELTDIHYESSGMSPLVKKVSVKPQTKKCIPMSVNN